jgi:NitT/TauT family transport system substrate-binding protein
MRDALRGFLVALLFVVTLGLTGATQLRAEPLKIAYSDWPGWIAWEVAIQKGFFKEAGIEVEFVWMDYLKSMEAFAAGKVDAVVMTNGDAMVTGATGKASTCILLTDYSNGNDQIIGKPGINSLKDLKGKTIGLEQNLVPHLLLLKALEANGMKEDDVTIKNVPTNDTPQALASGGVDAIAAWYPIAGQALKQVAGSKALFTSADAPGLIYDGLYVSKESLLKNKADWTKVATVWFKTVDFIKAPATKDEAIKIMAAKAGVEPAEYEKNLAGTFLLDLPGNIKAYDKSDALTSVYGSSKSANAFNVKFGVYKEAQDVDAYLSPAIVKALAAEKK